MEPPPVRNDDEGRELRYFCTTKRELFNDVYQVMDDKKKKKTTPDLHLPCTTTMN